MAYHDLNGKIMIDEVSAKRDIKQEEAAIEILKEAVSALKLLAAEMDAMEGAVPSAIQTKAQELQKAAQKLTDQLTTAKKYTQKILADYKSLDQKYAALLADPSHSGGGGRHV
ncbi:MAG: hypothetical protein IJ744_11500 [Lachnospiraceae bacterium]|nr:hypothetical protein [Lachnospiraceae bacterium]